MNVVDGLQEMMVIVPVDAEENEAEYITPEHREDRLQRLPRWFLRHLQFQDHDG